MIWDAFKALVICTLILFALYIVIIMILKHVFTVEQQDADIHIVHHEGRWGYYFDDPCGGLIIGGTFRTERGAQKTAQRHRDAVAKELEEALGL